MQAVSPHHYLVSKCNIDKALSNRCMNVRLMEGDNVTYVSHCLIEVINQFQLKKYRSVSLIATAVGRQTVNISFDNQEKKVLFNTMASGGGACSSGRKFELIDRGRLRVCFCRKCDCFLGGGTYGKVFKATATRGKKGPVAIKYPDSECHVQYEINNLKRLDHRNVLKYDREFEFGIHT